MKPLQILAIDDDIHFAEILRIRLESWGHDVVIKHNWLAVMIALNQPNFDLIIADVETPTGNGLTAIEQLSQDPEIASIPKCFVTGLSDSQTIQRCCNSRATYLHKSPILFDELQRLTKKLAASAPVCSY
ncbi:Transcriptional regulatory protein ZraR [Roseimaritima multifibrata]|uniref:Transcriptional regulatory protein ZraR n=1 Tax=Roseimaritima multifibrata TaxID=1930274 RepID=A0A517MLM3_9BACT|nr:response regulator [Roseimaritima multifibrata]QDS95788.1 Transcriptional regulatory protein ZraR [Roseimaritima multifibrata]